MRGRNDLLNAAKHLDDYPDEGLGDYLVFAVCMLAAALLLLIAIIGGV